jgi:hypothetical protein
MFAFLSYNGGEPGWASAMRESDFPGLTVYSPGLPLEEQLEAIGDDLSARQPNVLSCTFNTALRLEGTIGLSLCDALPTLIAADSCSVTSQMIYRDLYLLVRSDVLIVDAHSTNELAVYAFLLGIPVVAVSYGPTGLHPWLTHCAQATVHSPESIQEILDVLTPATPNIAPPEEPCLPAEETLTAYEYTCEEGHVFESPQTLTACNIEDCGAEGVEECGSPVTRT